MGPGMGVNAERGTSQKMGGEEWNGVMISGARVDAMWPWKQETYFSLLLFSLECSREN